MTSAAAFTDMPEFDMRPLDRSRHAAPQVFEHLRELIVAMRIAPGTVLQRADLAARYGLSQTPIRDALIKLGEEGMVDIFPQHATVVSAVNVTLARQAHFLRRSLELEIVRTLAQAPDAALVTRLRDSVELQKLLAERENYADFVLADQAFHRQMYEAAQVPELWAMVRRQSGNLDRLRNLHLPIPGKAGRVIADHVALVDAIAAGDGDAAQAALREHLSGTLSQLDDIRQRFPHYLKD